SRYRAGGSLGDFGADLCGVGMVQAVEDAQCFFPGFAGGVGIAEGVVGVAEAAEGTGHVVLVAEIAADDEGLPVARNGSVVVTQLVMDVAKTVQDARLTLAVSQFADQRQGALAVREGLCVFVEQSVKPADVRECLSLADPMAGGPVQVKFPLG